MDSKILSREKLASNLQPLASVRAFTMTEIIVVVGVMALLLSIGVGYTQKGGKQIVLFREHAQLTQQILRARSFATQKLRPEEELICGYGIALSPGSLDGASYTLFKDLPSGGCPGTGKMDAGEELEVFTMDKEVQFFGELNQPEFVFSPRDGFVYFGRERAQPGQEVVIPLELKGNNQQLILHINYIGQVYTE